MPFGVPVLTAEESHLKRWQVGVPSPTCLLALVKFKLVFHFSFLLSSTAQNPKRISSKHILVDTTVFFSLPLRRLTQVNNKSGFRLYGVIQQLLL